MFHPPARPLPLKEVVLKPSVQPLSLVIGLTLAPTVWANAALELPESAVSASALAHKVDDMVVPAAVLDGEALLLKRGANLGETLEHLPGMRSSSFGAGAGRPVIRGLDGARVKVLSDGVDLLDTSTISPDHALTSEPLLTERIEVLKGPASLLYGGGAIGGVVNVLDRKVPTYIPEKGYEGELELRANTVANEGAGVFGVTAGAGHVAVRVEGVKRQADDYEIPGTTGENRSKKQDGAYNNTDTFNVGASFIGERGYIGAAYGEQNNRYGLLAHEHADCHTHGAHWHCGGHGGHGHAHDEEGTPYVDMQQKRWDIRGELTDPLPGFELARLRVGHSDYVHREMEGDELGTRFESKATDARLELAHRPIAGWHGVVGAQTLRRDFQALGDEAYVPPSLTRNHALFVLEEYRTGNWRYELGLRHEWQDISADGHDSRRHSGTSASAGVVWSFAKDYAAGLSFSRSQRLPASEELYAFGPHAASRTVELGNADLTEETSHNLELSLRKTQGPTTFNISVYRNEIDDFIHAADTGENIGGGYREIEYRQHDARLYGLEGEVRFSLSQDTGLGFFGDAVRGKLEGGGKMARMPADRLGVRVDHAFNHALSGELEFYRSQHQHRLADYEQATSGFNMLNAQLSYQGITEQTDYLVYLKAQNLLDERARQHTSFIKDDVLLPGRNLTVGVRVAF